MTRTAIPLITATLLAACTANSPDAPATPPPPAEGTCDAAPVQDRIGQPVTTDLGAELLRLTGARSLRWGPPGAAMTMDFRPDRLTVSYDEKSLITRITCG